MRFFASPDIGSGFHKARDITRTYAKSFYFASHFLPLPKRYAAYAVYAICRLSDHSVDKKSEGQKKAQLDDIAGRIAQVYSGAVLHDSLLLAFRKTVEEYQIPKIYFDDLIKGMQMDLEKDRYRDFEELKGYCYRVAGVVGLIMLKIFEYSSTQAEENAVDLGIAMQLTNITRDIKEDYGMGRIYFPEDEMKKFGVNEEMIRTGRINDPFVEFYKFQIKRAREYYQKSTRGIGLIKNRRSRFVTLLMKEIYAAILDVIEEKKYDVFKGRAYVNRCRKVMIAAKVLCRARYL